MYEFLFEAVGGDVNAVRAVLSTFFESSRKQLEEMRSALTTGDAQRLNYAAHQLAGGLVTCGMSDLSQQARNLEQRALHEPVADLAGEVEHIATTLQQAEMNCDADLSRVDKNRKS